MKLPVSEKELEERIELNYNRLKDDPYYKINQVFSPSDYGWMGDKEGRVMHRRHSHRCEMTGKRAFIYDVCILAICDIED